MSGTLPSPRSWHASSVLPRERIFIHGGYDGNQILTDSFVFELGEFILFGIVAHVSDVHTCCNLNHKI